ncbi:hypothetical protein F900_01424 [Acinetobacter modestus]|uniref:Endonuclease/exonuclease/phosphatase domain-containing protein n=1 Tax=Acinetobacter modestus TaxID=1776740 RepID=N9LZJ4_9GAMM|nr:endonuclease/exonuclease/phosphatase family protein [Acinetobacter modestus]ENX01664.1 hypothetical protein F900_01424 [Acinetobacter modestus]
MKNFELSIIWWNTSLSPPISSKRDQSSDEERIAIASIIKLFMENDYQFICLGEVGPEDLDFFERNISPQALGYFCAKGIDGVGRTFFDTCIYYKKSHDLIRSDNSDVTNFKMSSGTRTFKYGQKYSFLINKEEKITLYLSHWPSRLNDVSLQVSSIAERLRINIEDEMTQTENIILIGDYNVEPYDPSIVHHLQTSREKTIVQKKPNIFYNPCWKFLIPPPNSHKFKSHGTYFYANGNFHNWHVIDQIMFSNSFLTHKWDLQDKYINIVNIPDYLDGKKYIFSDHNPLSAIILRK